MGGAATTTLPVKSFIAFTPGHVVGVGVFRRKSATSSGCTIRRSRSQSELPQLWQPWMAVPGGRRLVGGAGVVNGDGQVLEPLGGCGDCTRVRGSSGSLGGCSTPGQTTPCDTHAHTHTHARIHTHTSGMGWSRGG